MSSAGDERMESFVARRGPWLVMLCALLLTSGLWWHDVRGHSYPLNLVWHEGFVAGLRNGEIYPRWLTTTNQGLGGPAFYFYAPLPFAVSSVLDLVSPLRGPASAYVYGSATLAIFASGLAMFALVRRVWLPTTALLAATAYMAMPYHLGFDLWWRAALGELWAFVWLPLIIVGVHMCRRKEPWGAAVVGAAWAGLIMSHLPSFLIATCAAGVAAAAWWWLVTDRRAVIHVIVRATLAMSVAVAATAGYWFPALTTLGYTDVTHFMTSGWFLWSNNFVLPYRSGTWNGTVEFLVLAMLLLLCALSLAAIRWQFHRSFAFRMSAGCIAIAVFMMTPASSLIWQVIPPLQREQFPWRFLILVDLGSALLIAQVIDANQAAVFRRWAVKVLPVLCLIIGSIFPVVMTPSYAVAVATDLSTTLRTHADANEYRTQWTPAPFFYGVRSGDTVISLGRDVHALTPGADGRTRVSNDGSLSVAVTLNRFWYPSLRITNEATSQWLDVHPEKLTGLAVVSVPPGIHVLRVHTVMLREELIGWTISAAGSAFALAWLVFRRAREAVIPSGNA